MGSSHSSERQAQRVKDFNPGTDLAWFLARTQGLLADAIDPIRTENKAADTGLGVMALRHRETLGKPSPRSCPPSA